MAAVNPTSWSATAASNTALDGISTAENVMTVAAVNNAFRSLMAGVKEALNVLMGAKTTAGTDPAYTLTSGLSLSAYSAGVAAFLFKASFTNTGAATLNVDGVGAKSIKRQDGSALTAGDITSGGLYLAAYEATADVFILLTPLPVAGASTGVTSTSAITDNTIVRGDGGVRGIQGSTPTIDDSGNLTVGTSASITTGTVELGNASDTTLSRSAAGVIAVEAVPLYSNIPQNSKSQAYTTVLGDAQKHLLHPSADTTARTFTIDSNANVAYPIGTAITFVNQHSAGVMTIAITSDTMRIATTGTTGSRTLAADGIATALKVATTEWIISGSGLT